MADSLGRGRREGWFDPVPELAPSFDVGRATRRPMVRGHDGVDDMRFWGSDDF